MEIFVLSFAIFIACSSAVTIQEQRQQMIAIATDCKTSTGASDTDLTMLVLKKPIATKEGKCLLACIMETKKLIDGTKLNEKNFSDFVSIAAKNDVEITKKVTEIALECAKTDETDKCEMVAKFSPCLKKGMTTNKIKVDIGI
ncbi:hypothetical protein PVAND_017055 [Polypedilum vanderplanki]|uniref:Odorant binding protein n=1 Tax=Polypedilum vanderplanki TaxID=319348 RepID=A0A9J6BHM0_POLVA|nr:hypothetical protein PVAND_017055 [Polypedilum vanderplanki]